MPKGREGARRQDDARATSDNHDMVEESPVPPLIPLIIPKKTARCLVSAAETLIFRQQRRKNNSQEQAAITPDNSGEQ
jgi:hypothetical protein